MESTISINLTMFRQVETNRLLSILYVYLLFIHSLFLEKADISVIILANEKQHSLSIYWM